MSGEPTVTVPEAALRTVCLPPPRSDAEIVERAEAKAILRAFLPPTWSDGQLRRFVACLYGETFDAAHPLDLKWARRVLSRLHAAGFQVTPPEHLGGK